MKNVSNALGQHCQKHWGLPGVRVGVACPYCEPAVAEPTAAAVWQRVTPRPPLQNCPSPVGLHGRDLYDWLNNHPGSVLVGLGCRILYNYGAGGPGMLFANRNYGGQDPVHAHQPLGPDSVHRAESDPLTRTTLRREIAHGWSVVFYLAFCNAVFGPGRDNIWEVV